VKKISIMASDKRYGLVRSLFREGETYTFIDVFDIIPKTVIAKDLGMNYHTFTRKAEDPERFTLQEIMRMAEMFGMGAQGLCERVFMAMELKVREKEAEARDTNSTGDECPVE
jgi:hypothetical protein